MIGSKENKNRDQSPPCIVPHNSTVNFGRQRGGGLQVMENSADQLKSISSSCPHCQNMAKNFLYLESLIRTNCNSKRKHCSICDSSLAYLEYVNKDILEAFGSFDSIAQASKAFENPKKLSVKGKHENAVKPKIIHPKPSSIEGTEKGKLGTIKKKKPSNNMKTFHTRLSASGLTLKELAGKRSMRKLKHRKAMSKSFVKSEESQPPKKASLGKRKRAHKQQKPIIYDIAST
uniref:Uncharacterized protein n=1 Tax=Stomoxys calcitrans TaxID=35570 RepID=A0A1I8Q6C3_STOCA